jgi:glycosyltransferase involved in cell wall biosynthesis
MKKPSIAFIDIVGIPYDGNTNNLRGLGGSETAIIQIAKHLQNIGFDVTVYNNQNSEDVSPGFYDDVLYKSVWEREETEQDYDIVISSRTVYPFLSPGQKLLDRQDSSPWYTSEHYQNIVKNAKLKVVWLHDTFSHGEAEMEGLLVNGHVDEIFLLSDWHMSYILNCHHAGNMRNYEVMKKKVFMTRNGMNTYDIEVDVSKKDPNLFVYNASVSKGMTPLLTKIWPRIRREIPEAKLTIIGGYYQLGKEPDEQQKQWLNLRKTYDGREGVHFTDIIPQKQIAEILAEAKFFLYPAAFPETFGISTLEAQYYNCVPITCRFGALEETALDLGSWKIDYAIEPNGLFPHINHEEQVKKFVDTALEAYHNPYLTQQKAYYGNMLKNIAGWDTVAKEWKAHFYKKLGWYMPVEEYREARRITEEVNRVYGRRTQNADFIPLASKKYPEKQIIVISPFYNGAKYVGDCIKSVASQDYENYSHILIDDHSSDDVETAMAEASEYIGEDRSQHLLWLTNDVNYGAVYNQINTIRTYVDNPDAIVVLLDGDDSLVNDPHIFDYINQLYHEGAEFTYGSCWSMADNIPLIAQPYPEEVKKNKSYRDHRFSWGLPYTHLRTFKKGLLDNISDDSFQYQGAWFRAGGDVSVFYAVLEEANPSNVVAVPHILVNYNDKNPMNDYKVNGEEQTRTAKIATHPESAIEEYPAHEALKKRILIGIPTARNIEVDTFKSIYDLEVPEGYEVDFQYFYGYNVEQVRNLIVHYTLECGYDYLFSVDSDIVLPKDTLTKMLAHDKDMVTGIYIQRIPGTHTIEVYGVPEGGGMTHIPYDMIKDKGLVEVAGCGFGCVLVKRDVMASMSYPHFVYQSAIDHKNTISEDVYFCMKARDHGFRIWCDTSILCDHIGSTIFKV